jgi:hypothetical protein
VCLTSPLFLTAKNSAQLTSAFTVIGNAKLLQVKKNQAMKNTQHTEFFNSDRFSKYGWGSLRLLVVTLVCFQYHPISWDLMAGRWVVPCVVGALGAVVNVNQRFPALNILLLAFCGAGIIWDVLHHDVALVVYLFKTMGGDFFAGKLDTAEWKLSGLFALGFAAVCYFLLDDFVKQFGRIFLVLFVGQVFCEYGDNRYESIIFFRHRFSFEVLSLLLFFGLPNMSPLELQVSLMDLVACLFYRVGNFAIILMYYFWTKV